MRTALLGAFCLTLTVVPAIADSDFDKRVASFFERFDANKDGQVTPAEFADNKLFERLDVDKDGKITKGDFKPLDAKNTEQPPKDDAMARLFGTYDADKDGKLTRDEMKANPRLFHALDRNVDGVVDKAEAGRVTPAMLDAKGGTPAGGNGSNDMGGDNDMGGGMDDKPKSGAKSGGSKAQPMRPDGRNRGQRSNPMLGRMDTDGDGKISKAEWQAAQEKMFARLDKDGDGQLSAEELQAMQGMRGQRGQRGQQGNRGGSEFAKRIMQRMDKNGDGALTRDEMPERMAGRFDQMDGDGDGKVTAEELGKAFGRMRGQRGQDGRPGQRPGTDKPGTDKPGTEKPGTDKPGADAGQGGDRAAMFIKRLDKDGDGAVSKDEAPDRLRENFDRVDTNGDGKLTKDELGKLGGRRQRQR